MIIIVKMNFNALSIKTRKFQLDLLEAQGKDVLAKRLQLAKDELTLLVPCALAFYQESYKFLGPR